MGPPEYASITLLLEVCVLQETADGLECYDSNHDQADLSMVGVEIIFLLRDINPETHPHEREYPSERLDSGVGPNGGPRSKCSDEDTKRKQDAASKLADADVCYQQR